MSRRVRETHLNRLSMVRFTHPTGLEKMPHGHLTPEQAGAIGATAGGSCFGMIYPVLLLIFMFRPKVVAAFGPPDQP